MLSRSFLFILLTIPIFCQGTEPPAIKFIENKGQWPQVVLYTSDVPGGKIFFKKGGLRYAFYDTKKLQHMHDHVNDGIDHGEFDESGSSEGQINGHVLDVNFLNSSPKSIIKSEGELATHYNYFVGDIRAANAKAYRSISYESLYEGVDAKFYLGETLKYDLIVERESDPGQIEFEYNGAEDIFIDRGVLNIKTSVNKVRELEPYAYQLIDGKVIQVACRYVLKGNKLSFQFPDGYDPCYELVIDPALIFSTYSGSTADNWGNTATYDDDGNLYSGGITNHYGSGTFPATSGAFQTDTQGLWDVALLKYDSTGSELIYATYLGGSNSEVPQSLVADGDELIIMGVTGSFDYPTTLNAYDRTFGGGDNILPFTTAGDNLFFSEGTDIFVTKLDANGASLLGSTYIGGSENDGIMEANDPLTKNYGDQSRGDVFIKEDKSIIVASKTKSMDFPIVAGFQSTYGGGQADAVIISLSNDLREISWSSFLGGTGMDAAYSIKINSKNQVVCGGGSNSSSLHANFNNGPIGDIDGWAAVIESDGSALISGIFIGTTSYDQVYFVDLDLDDNIYTYGQSSGSFPVIGDVYTSGGGQFVQKRTDSLKSIVWSTKFGAGTNSPDISPTAFLVNECDNIYLSGWGGNTNAGYIGGSTSGLPVTEDAFQGTTSGSDFYLMTLDANASELLYATFLGGTVSNTHVDGGTSRFDKRGIVYHAVCAGCRGTSDFPTSEGAWSSTNNSSNCNNAAFKFDLASLRAVIQTNNTRLTAPGFRTVCVPDSIVFQNLSIGGELFEWDLGDGTDFTRTDTAYFAYQYSAPGTYNVTLKAIDPNTCIAEDISSTTVQVFDPFQRASPDGEICSGDSFQLTATGGTSYQWLSIDSTFSSEKPNPIVTPDDTTAYLVNIADANCNTLDTLIVNVIPEVDFSFNVEKIYDCFSRPSLKLTNTAIDADYTWDLGDGTLSNEASLLYDYESDGTYTVRLVGETGVCVYQREVDVRMVTIKVPNIFTPSDSDHNQTFEIISDSRENLKIYNRWGALVYEHDDYQDDWVGEEVPAGVYFYQVGIEDETTCTGWIHVFK